MKNSRDINRTSAQNQDTTKREEQEQKQVKKEMTFMPSMAQDEPTFDTEKEHKKKGGLNAILNSHVILIIVAVILSVLVGKMLFAAPTMSQYTGDINRHDTELLALHKQVDPMVTKVDGFNSKITSANETANRAVEATNGIQQLITTGVNNGLNSAITSHLSQYAQKSELTNLAQKSELGTLQSSVSVMQSKVDGLTGTDVTLNSNVIAANTSITDLKTQVATLTTKLNGIIDGTIAIGEVDTDGNSTTPTTGGIVFTKLSVDKSFPLNFAFPADATTPLIVTQKYKIQIVNNMGKDANDGNFYMTLSRASGLYLDDVSAVTVELRNGSSASATVRFSFSEDEISSSKATYISNESVALGMDQPVSYWVWINVEYENSDSGSKYIKINPSIKLTNYTLE